MSCTCAHFVTAMATVMAICAAQPKSWITCKQLGVDCVWLLPLYPSPLKDDGYDISDYYSIHPPYGTLEDFQAISGCSSPRGIRVILDLVLNHTSDQHPWFQAARADRNSPYRDYYVWSDTDQTLYRCSHHLPGYREVELDLG